MTPVGSARARAAVLGLAVALLAVACAAGAGRTAAPTTAGPSTTAPPAAVSGLGVQIGDATVVDASRPTEAPGEAPVPSRTLVLRTFTPDAPGRFPLVVFAHGLGGNPAKQDALLIRVASHGYVVVAVRFPLTTGARSGGQVVGDFVNQPADVSFVVDEMQARPPEQLRDRIDPDRLALIGHSLGGATVMAGATNSCCRDQRVDAVVAIAPADIPFPVGDYLDAPDQPPLLFVQGDADTSVRGDFRLSARYPEAAPPKFLLTILGGSHVSPVEGPATAQIDLVASAIADFLDGYVKGDGGGAPDLEALVAGQPELATLQAQA